MRILKYVHFIYLLMAIVFIYDGFIRIDNNEDHPWLSFLFAGVAIFMFFFRRKFAKKFDDRYKNK